MTLGIRLSKLERNRPKACTASIADLDLPLDLCARIAAAQAAGTFPQSLRDDDLLAIEAAGDKLRGWA